MSRLSLAAAVLFAATAAPIPLIALPAAAELQTAAEIDECVEGNFPKDSSIQKIHMVSKDRVGNANEMKAKMYWDKDDKGHSNVLMHFTEPPDLRNSALLILEKEKRNDMFMYLPELKKTRRVTSHMMSGSMFGTDFTYEEFERLQGLSLDLKVERLPDAEVDGRPVYVLDRTPGGEDGSEYEHIVSYVDKETCVSLETDFVKKGDRISKRSSSPFASVTKESSGWIPRTLMMSDLVEGTETTIEIVEIETGAKISRAFFSQSRLDRIGK